MELKTLYSQDASGNVVASPQVYVYLADTTTLALLQDRAGQTLVNPFYGTQQGLIEFRAPDGEYDVRILGAGKTVVLRVRCVDIFSQVNEANTAVASAASSANSAELSASLAQASVVDASAHSDHAEASATLASSYAGQALDSARASDASADRARASQEAAHLSETSAASSSASAAISATTASQMAATASLKADQVEIKVLESQGYASSALAYSQTASSKALDATAAALTAQNSALSSSNSAASSEASKVSSQQAASASQVSAASAAASETNAQYYSQQTAQDRLKTADDILATAADRVQTGLDRQATAADRVQTGIDRQATAADRVQTGIDRTQTGLDRVQTGSDRLASSNSAAASASSAAASLLSANNSQSSASASASYATAASTSAGQASGSAAQALAIYQNTSAMQSALSQAAAQASLAAGHAASASSVVQQDLSGVNAAALHRSFNTVTAMFVYDTSKDSDGGAWTEKCQHTSWYSEPLSGKWLGAQVSEAAARAVSGATTGDYFQLTTNGKFYKLNDTSGTTEVFRGNKREFPKLSAIVAEASNVTIYDLTEPGRPMWMRFASTGARTGIIGWTNSGSNVSSLAASNGYLMIGNVASGALVKFVTDSFNPVISGAYQVNGIQNLAQRNNTVTYTGASGTTNPPTVIVAGQNIYAVAMTVLPDAPVDPVTGLQVPTIAVATNGGVSVIKHNGTVVKSQATWPITNIIIKPEILAFTNSDWGFWLSYASNPGLLGASFAITSITGSPPDFFRQSFSKIFAKDRSFFARGNTNLLMFTRFNETSTTRSSAVAITSSYNTGHMVGEIRRTYLSDVDAGSVSGTELVTNGTFATDISGWSLNPGFAGGTVVWGSSGTLKLTNSGSTSSGAITTTPVSVIAGKSYVISFEKKLGGPNTAIYISTTGTTGDDLARNVANGVGYGNTVGTFSEIFVAKTNSVYISPVMWTYANGVEEFDNISLKEVVTDRSYKASGANITGTLTKTPVALGSQLCAFSGFSS